MPIINHRQPVAVMTCYNDGDIEYRPIEDNKVKAARPLYQETINSIFAGFKEDMKLKSLCSPIIPSNILHFNPIKDVVVWTNKASRKRLLFKDEEHTGTYALPALLFILKKQSLIVACLKSTSKSAKVYRSIFPNTSTSGVCMGSASIHTKNLNFVEECIEEAENKFFNSYFTHQITEALEESRDKKKFTYKLTSLGITLKDFIHGHI
jgi:hypothetical protein